MLADVALLNVLVHKRVVTVVARNGIDVRQKHVARLAVVQGQVAQEVYREELLDNKCRT